MTHKTIQPLRETAWGFLKTDTTTQRLNLAIRRMKAAPEQSGVDPKLEVEVRKFAIQCACCESADAERKIWMMLRANLDLIDSMSMHVIMTDMSRRGAKHVFIAAMDGLTSLELGKELGQVFNILYSCTDLVAVHGSEPNPIPDLMDIYVRNEKRIWISKLELDK